MGGLAQQHDDIALRLPTSVRATPARTTASTTAVATLAVAPATSSTLLLLQRRRRTTTATATSTTSFVTGRALLHIGCDSFYAGFVPGL